MAAVDGTPSHRKPSRRQPRSAVARAAVTAALEHGYERVTVEMICARADISRSSFFNHYPSRDTAILGQPLPVPGPEVTHPVLSNRPDDLVRGLLEMAVPALVGQSVDADVLRYRARLLAEEPAAMRQYSAGLISVQNGLTEAAEGWLRANPQHARLPGRPRTEAVLAVTAAYAAMYAASQWWSIPMRDVPDPVSACLAAVDALRVVVGADDPSRPVSLPKVPLPEPEKDTDAAPGLRERKRRDTENRIEMAAARGALERGFPAVTVDEICEEAVISRSTFFNYFPSRDAAIIGRPLTVLPREEAEDILSRHGSDTVAGAFALMVASIGHTRVNPEVARMRAELSLTQPLARDAGTATLVDAGTEIMATIRNWLAANPQHARLQAEPSYEASLASNAAYAGISALTSGWLGAAGDIQTSVKEFASAMADLRTVLSVPGR